MVKYLEGVDNLAVMDALVKSEATLGVHKKALVSISGGSDSDIVLDIIEKTKGDTEVEYVWFNTGLEFEATKKQLKMLEEKYGVEIHEIPPVKPIPTCCREYGIPFISKLVSEHLHRLQINGFQWEDEPYEKLLEKYPNSAGALRWWCNMYEIKEGFTNSMFNISQNKWLKEFIVKNPPTFKISNKCCTYSKKMPAKKCLKSSDADLNVIGVRKAEGGIRAVAYKSCYEQSSTGYQFRPVFWMTDEDKRYYEKTFGIVHSDCYVKYGFTRTGCVGCPYNRKVLDELQAVKMFEPKLYKACIKIFGASYDYTKKYHQFRAEMKDKENANEDQLSFDDIYYDFAQ